MSDFESQLNAIRAQFPVLSETVHGKPLVYLDNGASSQKPLQVIDAMSNYYKYEHANIHRGVHTLSQKATENYENSRLALQRYFNAAHPHEVIFTKGTTDAINLVSNAWGRKHLEAGDEVLISGMEHHSNIVPWQMICEERGATLKVIPVLDNGELDWDAFESLLCERTKMVAVVHVSNTLGTVNPIPQLIAAAHEQGAVVLIDGAQAVPHMQVDLQALDCDFYCASAHKMYGPTGIGFLYGKEDLLNEMPPYQGGGDMIDRVTFERTTYNDLPHKFEAGTPAIAAGIGFGAAIEWIEQVGIGNIAAHEQSLLEYGTQRLQELDGLRMIGESANKSAVLSFLIGSIHPYDLGVVLDQLGIAVRTGHHCTQPLMDRFEIPGTVRASFAVYNTKAEIDALMEGMKRAIPMLS